MRKVGPTFYLEGGTRPYQEDGEVPRMFDGRIHYQGGEGQDWCEFERTLKGEHCTEESEIRLDGLLLCETHARELILEERVAYWRAMLAHIELWSREARTRGREDIVDLLEIERSRASAALERCLGELERAAVTLASSNGRDGNGKGRDGRGRDGRVIPLWPPLLPLLF
jgi:hypothetical protein